MHLHEGFCGDPYGQAEDGRRARLGIKLRRVFRLQFVPDRRLEEDRHSVVSSAELGDLVDDFVGYPHGPIVLAILCWGRPRLIRPTSSCSPCSGR